MEYEKMVIDDCNKKPNDFPNICKGCHPYNGYCEFTKVKIINIPFNDWSKERIRYGYKTATTRRKKYGNKGDIFFVDEIKCKLLQVKKLRLSFIAYYLYDKEGAESPEEFIKVWNKIHPIKKYEQQQYENFWYHRFEKVKE